MIKTLPQFAVLESLLREIKRLRAIGQAPEAVWVAKILEQAGDDLVKAAKDD